MIMEKRNKSVSKDPAQLPISLQASQIRLKNNEEHGEYSPSVESPNEKNKVQKKQCTRKKVKRPKTGGLYKERGNSFKILNSINIFKEKGRVKGGAGIDVGGYSYMDRHKINQSLVESPATTLFPEHQRANKSVCGPPPPGYGCNNMLGMGSSRESSTSPQRNPLSKIRPVSREEGNYAYRRGGNSRPGTAQVKYVGGAHRGPAVQRKPDNYSPLKDPWGSLDYGPGAGGGKYSGRATNKSISYNYFSGSSVTNNNQHNSHSTYYSNLSFGNNLKNTSKYVTNKEVVESPSEGVGVLSSGQISELYRAKCKDLQIQYFANQEQRFYQYCATTCVDRKICLKECGMGLITAHVLKAILRKGRTQFYSMDIGKNMLGDEGAKLIGEGIRNNRSVVHFDISNNELSSRGGEQIIRGLADNESITSITLGSMEALHRNRLGPSCMLSMANMLKNNRVITFINLSSTSIRNEGVLNLSLGIIANPSILALNLSQNEISYEKASADAIVDMLTMSRIRDFDLSENPLGNQMMELISRAFRTSSCTLSKLGLSNCSLGSRCLPEVFKNLRQNASIRSLRLDRNNLNGYGINAFHDLIMTNRGIQNLYLQHCKLGDEGALLIAPGLAKNSALKNLVLSYNGISDPGAREISKHLSGLMCRLKNLDLSYNDIKDEGGVGLAQGILVNKSIQGINLKANNMGNVSGHAFRETLNSNKRITKIILNYNNINIRILNDMTNMATENVSKLRKSRVPQYHKEISKLAYGEDVLTEIEWNTEKLHQEQEDLESELTKELETSEHTKTYITRQTERTETEFSKIMTESASLDTFLRSVDADVNKYVPSCEEYLTDLTWKMDADKRKMQNLNIKVSEVKEELEVATRRQTDRMHKLEKELEMVGVKYTMMKIKNDRMEEEKEMALNNKEEAISPPIEKKERGKTKEGKKSKKEEKKKEEDPTTSGTKDQKQPSTFEHKEYNASPKLAIKKKRRGTQKENAKIELKDIIENEEEKEGFTEKRVRKESKDSTTEKTKKRRGTEASQKSVKHEKVTIELPPELPPKQDEKNKDEKKDEKKLSKKKPAPKKPAPTAIKRVKLMN